MRMYCQSCSMPIDDSNFGTESSGIESTKYCNLCYANGEFTNPSISVAEMEDRVYRALRREKHWPAFLARGAVRRIKHLERWASHTVSL